ncbi:hypothetical protein ACHAPT_009901 [Fusarium lateritium]
MAKTTRQFEFESRIVTGYGGPASTAGTYFRHVIHLALDDETRQDLPKHVVVKIETQDLDRQVEDDEENLFDTEVKIYQHLQHLQGEFIPKLYGLATVNGSRAMDESMPAIEEGLLHHQLRQPLQAIRLAGVSHEDPSAKNVLYCHGNFVVLDFELAQVRMGSAQDMAEEVDMQIDDLVHSCKKRQWAIRRILLGPDTCKEEGSGQTGFAGWEYYL